MKRILVVTAVESTYGTSFLFTWLIWLLYTLLNTPQPVDYSISIAVGCMRNEYKYTKGNDITLLGGLFKCSNLFDIPGFDKDKHTHLNVNKYKISYPDVRRMMFLRALANNTIQYDMIVHADVDAFIIRNPFPELIELKKQKFAAAFSRSEYNASGMCFGFFALNNLSLPYYWTMRGIYSQNQITKWMIGNAKLLPEKQEPETLDPVSYWNVPLDLNHFNRSIASVKLLHSDEYYRGGCGETAEPVTKVYHCHSQWFNVKKKEADLQNVSKLFNIAQLNIYRQAFQAVIQPEASQRIVIENYYSRDHGKVIPDPYNIIVNTHRLVLKNTNLINIIRNFSDWQRVCYAYSNCDLHTLPI